MTSNMPTATPVEHHYCCDCGVELDWVRDGEEQPDFRCNNCYWEDEEGIDSKKMITPDYRKQEEEVRCVCPKCFAEGHTFVSKERAKELEKMEEMEEMCPFGEKCNGEEEE